MHEQVAATWLEARGLQLLQRNFGCRMGEIDLIMTDGTVLVFVEVRYRRSARFGSAVETVDFHKRRRLLRCAHFYLATRGNPDLSWRFDVLGISPAPRSVPSHLHFDWIQNAFCE